MSQEINAMSVSNFRDLTSEEIDAIAGGKVSLRGLVGAMAGGALAGGIGGALVSGGLGAVDGALLGAGTAGVAYYVSGILEQ